MDRSSGHMLSPMHKTGFGHNRQQYSNRIQSKGRKMSQAVLKGNSSIRDHAGSLFHSPRTIDQSEYSQEYSNKKAFKGNNNANKKSVFTIHEKITIPKKSRILAHMTLRRSMQNGDIDLDQTSRNIQREDQLPNIDYS